MQSFPETTAATILSDPQLSIHLVSLFKEKYCFQLHLILANNICEIAA